MQCHDGIRVIKPWITGCFSNTTNQTGLNELGQTGVLGIDVLHQACASCCCFSDFESIGIFFM